MPKNPIKTKPQSKTKHQPKQYLKKTKLTFSLLKKIIVCIMSCLGVVGLYFVLQTHIYVSPLESLYVAQN